jgi:hypothetical protein
MKSHDPMRYLWRHLCYVSAEMTVALACGLAPCHDTDDTNRRSGDTRTIRWMVKMARLETSQMSLICRPNDARYQNGAPAVGSPQLSFTHSTLAHPST